MGRILSLIFLLIISTGARGEILRGYGTTDSVETRLSNLPLCPAEGIWQMASDGALFAIERVNPSPTETLPRELRLVIIKSPIRRVRPGTVMGTAKPTVKPGVYEAEINTRIADFNGLEIPRRFLLKVNPESSTLTIEPFRSPVKVNLLRLLPYMYRSVVRFQKSRPEGLDGAIRIYPPQAFNGLTPVYL